jgi:cleavage stimulation factor subunit 2
MAEYEGRTKVVFVGNLPYDATEQEVQKVFEVAGPVVSFRHVFDRDSNKAKGFGGGQANEHDLDAPQALR